VTKDKAKRKTSKKTMCGLVWPSKSFDVEVDELLGHIWVKTRQVAMLNFDVEAAAATSEKKSIAARIAAETA